jgi:DNA-binding winged helix-turn-helix (wHTH) protein/TolB-like protein/Flp pilus assembly protein TadD
MAIRQQKRCFYEFGLFRLNSVGRILLRDAEVVPLTPKQFDILLLLVENHGQVVEKERLIEQVWPDASVEEGNLTTNIYMLRKALGEGANAQQFIQTLPRRGYRFVAEVREVIPGDESTVTREPVELHLVTPQDQAGILPGKAITASRWARIENKWKLAFAALALLTVTAGAIYLWAWSKPNPAVKTVAVLPFKPLSSDSRNEVLELGMADTLINKLSGIGHLVVRPLDVVRKYTALDQDPLEAGRELGVDYVLAGNLQMMGEKTRANVRLLSVKDGSTVWADTCNEQCSNVFELQDAIAARIASALAIELTGQERQRLARHYTESTDAYRAYLTGRHLHHKRSVHATEKGIEYFEQAIRLDPNYALAYATLADAHLALAKLKARLPQEIMPQAKAAADKALELDDSLAEAHAAIGSIRFYEWDWSGAERAFKHASKLNPNYERNHSDYEHCLLAMKRFDEALAESKRVLELDPVSAHYNRNVAMILYFARRYDEAIEQCQKALELDPDMVSVYVWLGAAYEQKGLYDQAVKAYLKPEVLSGIGPEAGLAMREAYAALGWKGLWQKALELMKGQAKHWNANTSQLAEIYARLGEKDQAFALLEKAYEQRLTKMKFLNTDPVWDGLRSDPRYADLVRRMGLEP